MSRRNKTAVRRLKTNAGPERMMGKNLNFSATEAYKLLRTNLFFCLHAEDGRSCPVVGVTSSVQGEGKSTTSINLAYMLAEDDKRVCLIEGDMRAPTFNSRLNLRQSQGLSHVLAGLKTVPGVLCKTALHENLSIITAGDMPPNPAELLGSGRMLQLMELLREMFDYIVIDLPPVTVVADALAVSGALDGVLVVVEEGVCSKRDLADAMHRLEMISDKILGFVVTRAEGAAGRYGKKKYGGRYGYGYGNKK